MSFKAVNNHCRTLPLQLIHLKTARGPRLDSFPVLFFETNPENFVEEDPHAGSVYEVKGVLYYLEPAEGYFSFQSLC